MTLSLGSILNNLTGSVKKLPTNKKLLGIDIGSAAVKIVEIEKTERGPVLSTYGELQIGPYGGRSLGESVKLNQEQLTEVLVDILREAGSESEFGVLAMPLSAGFVTVVSLDIRKEDQIESRLPLALKEAIPFKLSSVRYDWIPLNFKENSKRGDETEVLVVAIRTEAQAQYQSILSRVEINQQNNELEIFSAMRATNDGSTSLYGLIDLGATVSKLYIVNKGTLERIHHVLVGGYHITQSLTQLISASVADAENIKRSPDPTEALSASIKKATNTTLDSAFREFKRVIDQYESNRAVTIEKIVLSGGVANTHGIVGYTTEIFQRKIEVANPFALIGYPAFMEDTIKTIAPTFTNSVGAALQEAYSKG